MSDSQICRLVQEMSQTLTLWRNVSVWKSPSKGWWPGWFWSGCFPIFWRARFPGQWRCFIECCRCAPLSWRGTRSSFQSRQLKSATGIRGRLQMARLGLPCLFLSIARSPSCVLARTRVCFLPTVLDKFTWRPIRATLVLYGGICRSNLMATPFRAIQNGHGCIPCTLAAGCFCRWPCWVLESCGSLELSRSQGEISSAVFGIRLFCTAKLGVATTLESLLW